MNIWVKAFGVVSVCTTLFGAYEIVFKERYAPSYFGYMNLCEPDMVLEEITKVGTKIYESIDSTVYIDLDIMEAGAPDDCPEWSDTDPLISIPGELESNSILLNSEILEIESNPTTKYAPQNIATLNLKTVENSALVTIGNGNTDFSGFNMVGLFSVKGFLEAGLYTLTLTPAVANDVNTTKHACNKALAREDGYFGWVSKYITECVF